MCALAVYRISNMIAQEDGAFDMFARLRTWVGQKSWIGRGIHCVLCVSFWAGIAGALAWQRQDLYLVRLLVLALGFSGAVLVSKKYLG